MRLTDLNELCDWTQNRAYRAGKTLFLEGDNPATVYQVVRGVVKLTRVSSQGREIIVGLACPGDFLDVVSILDGRPYGVSAAAVLGSEVEVVSVPRELAMRHSGLVRALERISLDELRHQRDWTVAMALERVETRAKNALCMLARRMGHGNRVQLLLNRQEFAELLGTTTETAIRILSQFRRQGLIQEQEGWLTLGQQVCAAA